MNTSTTSLYLHLQELIINSVPDAIAIEKYGGTLFTIHPKVNESQFCGIFPYTSYVQISFKYGSQLNDPNTALLGKGKHRRHINYLEIKNIDETYLTALIIQAASLN